MSVTMTIEEAEAFINGLQRRLEPLGLDAVINTEGLNKRDLRHVGEVIKEYCTERPKKAAVALRAPTV